MRGKRPGIVGLVAALLFLFVACYRFNTLGGALGGFDNDHFLHLSLAKQVEAGERPLRDFLDGVQGAPPALTYDLSALAQRTLGDNLRSEAILTVVGVALAAAVTFVAATHVAPWPVALVAATFSALLSPKLYGYPKVLVLAVACLLLLQYARTPTWLRVAALSAWTAVAFLFRHDYVVYCAVGSAIVLALAGPRAWLPRLGRLGAYGAITLVLLAPSLYWVERTAGLVTYIENGVSMGRRDAARTAIGWPTPSIHATESLASNFAREENTQAWLYYVFVALAWLTPLAAAARLRRGTGADPRDIPMLAVGSMTLLLSLFFLRGSLEARFGDMGPPLALAAAWLVALSGEGSQRSWSSRAATAALAAGVFAVSAAALWELQSVRSELDRAGLRSTPVAVAAQTARVWHELGEMPETLRGPDVPSPSGRAAGYLNRCTTPDDRVMVVSYAPEVVGLSGRRFAAGRPTFMPGFFEGEQYARFVMAKLQHESVPIVLAEDEPYYAKFPLLAPYLRDAYVEEGRIEIDGGRTLRVLARRGRAGRPDGPAGLPCFAPAATAANGLSQLR